MNNAPFTIERTYRSPIEKVWKAITDRDDMRQWYFDLKEFKLEVGFEFQFTGGPSEDRQYLHLCKVTEVIAGKKITYRWQYDGHAGISYVTFELFSLGSETKLILTHSGLETFPSTNPDFAKERFAAGWTAIAGASLKRFVERPPR
jgi:uncharacterized protein YndB with AHSA1/START domain